MLGVHCPPPGLVGVVRATFFFWGMDTTVGRWEGRKPRWGLRPTTVPSELPLGPCALRRRQTLTGPQHPQAPNGAADGLEHGPHRRPCPCQPQPQPHPQLCPTSGGGGARGTVDLRLGVGHYVRNGIGVRGLDRDTHEVALGWSWCRVGCAGRGEWGGRRPCNPIPLGLHSLCSLHCLASLGSGMSVCWRCKRPKGESVPSWDR